MDFVTFYRFVTTAMMTQNTLLLPVDLIPPTMPKGTAQRLGIANIVLDRLDVDSHYPISWSQPGP